MSKISSRMQIIQRNTYLNQLVSGRNNGLIKIVTSIRRCGLFLITMTVLCSCIEFNGSGLSDLSETEKQKVKTCTTPLDSLHNDGNLYKVTAKQVDMYIKSKKNVLVYEYLPFCKGESGRSPAEVKLICDKKKWDYIVISSVYDGIFPIPSSNTFPMFVIDNSVYNTDNYQTYSNLFYFDLTNEDGDERTTGVLHYFNKGKYVRSYSSIDEINL